MVKATVAKLVESLVSSESKEHCLVKMHAIAFFRGLLEWIGGMLEKGEKLRQV